MSSAVQANVTLPFDLNDYTFLVYDPKGRESSIVSALEDHLGIVLDPNRDIRTAYYGNRVTLEDLQTHDILIVGWNDSYGDVRGLNANMLATAITGRIILSGHDLDYHTALDPAPEPAAPIMLSQAIDFVLKGGGTGMIALGCVDGFPYLPEEWHISASVGGTEVVTEFTFEGLDSGVFDHLELEDMCDWGTSYHDTFTINSNSPFVSFELGGENEDDDIITVARINPFGLNLAKADHLDPNLCVAPTDEITYTIAWNRPPDAYGDPGPLELVDVLPTGVDFVELIDASDGSYDGITHTITWHLGAVGPGDEGSRTFKIVVNDLAEPTGALVNRAALYNSAGMLIVATEKTPVCCRGGAIIYVDQNAVGYQTGMSWRNAYTDLDDALHRAALGCGHEIWVAQGTYAPPHNPQSQNAAFRLTEGVALYGGFAGHETARHQRDFTRYQTILSGYIGKHSYCKLRNIQVVTMGDQTVLDGFIVRKGNQRGIYGNGNDFSIFNCIIEDNPKYGIYAENGDVTINWSIIKNNGSDGIYHAAGGFALRVENCQVSNNAQNGIYCHKSHPTIINSIIHENGAAGDNYYGIHLDQPSYHPDIRNNTIVRNRNEAVGFAGSRVPVIYNCILWNNNTSTGLEQLAGYDDTWFCCRNDPNNPAGSATPDARGNISCEPRFAYHTSNYGNYHLEPASPCIDAGGANSVVDPNGYGEYDIDAGDRIIGDRVDMGADEVACENVFHPVDLTTDGLVNLVEYDLIAAAWLSEDPKAPWRPTDPNRTDHWDGRCDLDKDDVIDLADLVLFYDAWLWRACWRSSPLAAWMYSPPAAADPNQTITTQRPPLQTTPNP